MKTLSRSDYDTLRDGATVLEADGRGDKVLQLTDGRMLKLFRRKRLISSALWSPYARRFARAATLLAERNVPAPVVIDVFRIPAIRRDGVLYHPLQGRTLRAIVAEGLNYGEERALKNHFTRFLVGLHDQGIYFRSLHLGSVVYTPDGEFGLIDISDLKVGYGPLPEYRRARNLRRMLALPGEADWIDRAVLLNPAARTALASA